MTGRRAVYRWAATTSQWLAYSATTITGWSGNVSQVSRNAALKSSGWPTLDASSVALLNVKRRGAMGSKEISVSDQRGKLIAVYRSGRTQSAGDGGTGGR
jgi:hypothetical protein